MATVSHKADEIWEKTRESMPDMNVIKENASGLWEKTKDTIQVIEQKTEEGLDKMSSQIMKDFAREAHHAETQTTTTLPTSTTIETTTTRTTLPMTIEEVELRTPLLESEKLESNSGLIESNLEVNKKGVQTNSDKLRLNVDPITTKDLLAETNSPQVNESFPYAQFGGEQKCPVDHIPTNGGLPVNTDTKMVNNLKGLKDPHVDTDF